MGEARHLPVASPIHMGYALPPMFTATATAILILFIAATVQGTIGFGFGMVSMALLTALLPVSFPMKLAVPMVALFGICVNSSLLFQLRRDFSVQRCLPLVLGGLVGLPAGVYFLDAFSEDDIIKRVLGAVIVAYVVWSVLDRKLASRAAGRPWGILAGVTGGFFGGAFNTSGPPAVMYLATQPWKPNTIKATLQGFFFFASVVQLSLFAWVGKLTREVFVWDAKLLAPVLVGVWFGAWVSKRVDRALFQRLVLGALFILGVLFLVR